MAIEIVDLPIKLIVIFHSYVKLPEGIDDEWWMNGISGMISGIISGINSGIINGISGINIMMNH